MSTRSPGTRTISRDTITFVGGWALIIYEALRPESTFNPIVFIGGMVIVGVPGAAAVFSIYMQRGGPGIGSSPSPPQVEASSSQQA